MTIYRISLPFNFPKDHTKRSKIQTGDDLLADMSKFFLHNVKRFLIGPHQKDQKINGG